MTALARLAVALALLGSGAAQALEERAAARTLLAAPGQATPAGEPACIGIAPWGAPAEGVFVVAAANDQEEIVVALMRDGADGQPAIVAGPATFEPIMVGPLWACVLRVVAQAPLGGRAVLGVNVSTSYTSTARSTSTAALHLLLVEGATLRMRVPTLAETDIDVDAEANWARHMAVSANTRPFNYLGLPTVSVPCGLDDRGLPMGLQLSARPFGEGRALMVADAYQQDTDWHARMPPLA